MSLAKAIDIITQPGNSSVSGNIRFSTPEKHTIFLFYEDKIVKREFTSKQDSEVWFLRLISYTATVYRFTDYSGSTLTPLDFD